MPLIRVILLNYQTKAMLMLYWLDSFSDQHENLSGIVWTSIFRSGQRSFALLQKSYRNHHCYVGTEVIPSMAIWYRVNIAKIKEIIQQHANLFPVVALNSLHATREKRRLEIQLQHRWVVIATYDAILHQPECTNLYNHLINYTKGIYMGKVIVSEKIQSNWSFNIPPQHTVHTGHLTPFLSSP